LLNSQKLIKNMALGSPVLEVILVTVAKILTARYPGSNMEEAQLIKVGKI